jgi:hypothetical protein
MDAKTLTRYLKKQNHNTLTLNKLKTCLILNPSIAYALNMLFNWYNLGPTKTHLELKFVIRQILTYCQL